MFTQQCTKHAKFWADNAAKFQGLDLVVPLRDPREYGMSREAFDLSEGVGKGLWSADEKQRRLRGRLARWRVSCSSSRAGCARRRRRAAGSSYTSRTRSRSRPGRRRQVVDFFALKPFLDRGGDSDVALAAAVERATRVPDARARRARVEREALGGRQGRARHGAMREWYGAERLGRRASALGREGGRGRAPGRTFPVGSASRVAQASAAAVAATRQNGVPQQQHKAVRSQRPVSSERQADVLDTSIWPGANDEWTNVGLIGFLAVFLTVVHSQSRLSPPHETSGPT